MDRSLPAILRVHHEPGVTIDDASVHAALMRDPVRYIAFIRDSLAAIAAGTQSLDLPPKQVFPDPDGAADFRVMPCVIRGAHGVRKTVKIVGTNIAQSIVPDQITVGRTFALHPIENFITHTFDACVLSSARTGACATMAVQLLAPQCKQVAILGAGRVAYYTASFLCALDLVESLYISDIDGVRAEALCTALRAAYARPIEIVAGRPPAQVDAVVLATTSREPIYGPADFFARTVVSLGADSQWQRELDPALVNGSRIYVDTLDSVRYGDLSAWIDSGLVAVTDLIDLLALVQNGPIDTHGERELFISTGSAMFDNFTVGYLLANSTGDTLTPR